MSGAGFFGAGAEILGAVGAAQMSAQANERMQLHQLKWEREKLGLEQAYNTEMANSAHQREIADLKAAGLNPILSAGGSGAPSPTIQGGSIGALPDQSGAILQSGISSAFGHFIQETEVDKKIKQMEHQNDLIDAERLKAIAETGVANKKALEITANTALLKSQKDLTDEQWNQQIQETQLAYYRVQTAFEELKYARQNAKNKADILAAEKKLKVAEADMKNKENKLWYFSYAWDKGMDIGKILGTIVGLGKFGKLAGALNMENLPGMKMSAKSNFGFDKTTGYYY